MNKFALTFLTLALADLPVHCLRHQVSGKWRFHLGPLSATRTQCGHQAPDVEGKQPALRDILNGSTTEFNLDMMEPNVVQENGKNGTWTMVYDEGFYVDTPEKHFFAFSHFLLSDPNSVDWFQKRVHGKKVFRSVCAKTEVGWYQDKETGQWGCFYGERTDVKDVNAHRDFLSFIHVIDEPSYVAPLSFAQHKEVAADINKANDGWVAAAYPQYDGLSLEQLNKRAGNARYHVRREEKSFLALARREAPAAEKASAAKKSDLPEELSWRNVNGTSWVDPVSDQGECGSCYAVSSTNMLTSRHRVAARDPKAPAFSIGFSLYCSDVNQGCNGGYPFLTSMWSADVGLVTTECAGKYHVDTNLECPAFLEHAEAKQKLDKCMAGKEAAVTDFGYVGGYYGACTEEGMMQALLDGPITVALEPAMDFMYYKSGVYSSVKDPEKKKTWKSSEWYKVDHAVLVVGWGVDKTGKEPKKYWLVQNSWGPDWGEDGYIRVAKGENESGIEFQALQAHVAPKATKATPLHSFLEEHRTH